MKIIAETWFECKVRYDKVMEDGMSRKITETYVVMAISFSEAEAKINKELSPYIEGDFSIVGLKIANYREVIFEVENSTSYFLASIALITYNERTGKEKRTKIKMLVPATNVEHAAKVVNEAYSNIMIDYGIISVIETPIVEVFE